MPLKQILLIEDDIDDQELFISSLEKIDLSVDCKVAGYGQEALGKLTNQGSHTKLDLPRSEHAFNEWSRIFTKDEKG